MIPFDRIILEMERQLSVAKRSDDERRVREALSAVRSLCEVALGNHEVTEQKVFPKMLSTESNVTPISLEAKPLAEQMRMAARYLIFDYTFGGS